MVEDDAATLDAPITRREVTSLVGDLRHEFKEGFKSLAGVIDELRRARQISWPLVVSMFGVAGTFMSVLSGIALVAVGFSIKNYSDQVAMGSTVAAHEQALHNLVGLAAMFSTVDERSQANAETATDLRQRTRGLESNTHAIMIEGESQNRWAADVVNLEATLAEQRDLAYCAHCDREGIASRIVFPERRYWPLSKIGDANPINGSPK